MRLFLHGRSTLSRLSSQLQQARNQQMPITSLLVSSWNADDLVELTQDLCDYLLKRQQQCQVQPLEEITLQNCKGDLQSLVAAILETSPQHLIIRFDKQRYSMPASMANGLIQGAQYSRIQKMTLRGMTLTPAMVDSLRLSLPTMETSLESLSIQGKFVLQDFDRKEVTIIGQKEPGRVVDGLIELLRELPNLECLDLENCHIPDDYLADILEACPMSSLKVLRLRGNLCMRESMGVLQDWLIQPYCQLQVLDLSWQRLPESKRNYSRLEGVQLLAKALSCYNTSLHTLRLSENWLLDSDVQELCVALKRNQTLQTLELKDCRITMAGFCILAQALPTMMLRRLDLNGHQRVTTKDCVKLKKLFFEPLVQNVYLYDLVLPQNLDSKSLGWLLEWNRAGRRVLVEPNNGIAANLWPTLLAKADRVGRQGASFELEQERRAVCHGTSAIYHLLREQGFTHIGGQEQHQKEKTCTSSTKNKSSFCLPRHKRVPSDDTAALTVASLELTQSQEENEPVPQIHNNTTNHPPNELAWLSADALIPTTQLSLMSINVY